MRNRTTPLLLALMLFAFPASSNYELQSYNLGGGGGGLTNSTAYSADVVAGELSGDRLTGTAYQSWPGLIFTQMANTPTAPTVTNDATYYNKLKVVVNTASNPSDTKYAIAVSTDNFTSTSYLQSDNTVGATLGAEDWQTYTDWGGGTGEFAVGLTPATTYYFKVKAERGDFTEGPWGPVASVATSALTLSFDLDVSTIDEETAEPYAVSLGTLSPGSVITSASSVWVDLTTNALGGGIVYVYGSSAGLHSASTGYTISGVSANLAAVNEGFGLRSLSVGQSAGGPLAAQSPYNGSSDNVGTVSTTALPIFSSSTSPITSGRGSLAIKVKVQDITPSAADYSEALTFIAASSF